MENYSTPDEAVLALEAPLRSLARMLSRDEVEAILREALADVFEHVGQRFAILREALALADVFEDEDGS